MTQRAVRVAFLLAMAVCVPPAPPPDPEWEAYLEELRDPILPAFDPKAEIKPSLPYWLEGPLATFEAIYGEGTGRFPDRPTWQARRWIAKEMEARGLVEREFDFVRPPATDGAIEFLAGACRHPDWTIRAVASFVLEAIPKLGNRPDANERLVAVLLANLDDEAAAVRAMALYSLRDMADARIASRIEPLLRDPDRFARHNAACALARFGHASRAQVAVLRRDLRHPHWWMVAGAEVALMKMGSAAAEAVPDLLGLLRHDAATVRRNAYSALEVLDPASLAGNPDAERVKEDLRSLVPQIRSLPK